jgi:hypothetical protein
MRLPEQVKRLGFVLAVIVAAVLLLRFVILPPSMFSAKPHQAAAAVREMAKPIHHAGVAECRKCHEEQYQEKYGGAHRNINCENCHGPSAEHAVEGKEPLPPRPREREFCLRCHSYDASRPNGFPQVDPQEHNPRKKCLSCHEAHDPVPPKTPQDCGGCHGRIARIKALSTHALVECSSCHTVDERHMTEPRLALPTKPGSREVCGACHAAGSTDPGASKMTVDLATHGGTYLCWQCHYAHLPEGRK